MGANESENAAMMATCKIIAEGQKFLHAGTLANVVHGQI